MTLRISPPTTPPCDGTPLPGSSRPLPEPPIGSGDWLRGTSPFQHGGNLWALMETEGLCCPQGILDFSADLNPLGPPEGIWEILQESVRQIRWYPDPFYCEFCRVAAQTHGVTPSCILPGNGSADLIHLVARLLGKVRAAVAVPTFTEYERALRAAGASVLAWDPHGSFPDQADVTFLCNPNNPTGTCTQRALLLEWVRRCQRNGAFLVVDEAAMDLVENRLRFSMAPFVSRFENLIVLRSFSKAFSVPGLRMGYLVASSTLVKSLREIQAPWPVSAPAARVGTFLLSQEEFLAFSRLEIKRLAHSLWEELQRRTGLAPLPSAAPFFLCRITDPQWTGRSLSERLKEEKILVRVCDDFTGLPKGRFVRISVRRSQENQKILLALAKILPHGC